MQKQVAKRIRVISIDGGFHSLQKLCSVICVNQLRGRQELGPSVRVNCMMFLLLVQHTRQQIIGERLEALDLFKRQVLGWPKKEGAAVVELAPQVVEDQRIEFKAFGHFLECILIGGDRWKVSLGVKKGVGQGSCSLCLGLEGDATFCHRTLAMSV